MSKRRRGLSSLLGSILFVVVFAYALVAFSRLAGEEISSLSSEREALEEVYQRLGQDLSLTYCGEGICVLNDGAQPVSLAYALRLEPFSYERLGVLLQPGQSYVVRGNYDAVLTGLGSVFSPANLTPWRFFLYQGEEPECSGYFELAQMNFSLGWEGGAFPFPSGYNGSSLVAVREVWTPGGSASFFLEGGEHSLWLDGVQIIAPQETSWRGSLAPGTYLLTVTWKPLGSGFVDFGETGVYPCQSGSS